MSRRTRSARRIYVCHWPSMFLAAFTGDSAYINAIDRIWDNIVGKNITSPAASAPQAMARRLARTTNSPNMSAYCETCAAIGNVYVNHRLFLPTAIQDIMTLRNAHSTTALSPAWLSTEAASSSQPARKHGPAPASALVRLRMLPVEHNPLHPRRCPAMCMP